MPPFGTSDESLRWIADAMLEAGESIADVG
jgi:hypothetical protein